MVIRFRLRSATPEDPREEDKPPPNMSDRPPPFPLCIRMDRINTALVSTSSTSKMMRNASTCGVIPHVWDGAGSTGHRATWLSLRDRHRKRKIDGGDSPRTGEIGRASCRERG